MIYIPFPFLLAEALLFFWFWSRFGFLPVFAAYWIPSAFGALILGTQSRSALISLQTRLAQGKEPGFEMMNVGAKFLAGLLLLAPFFSTRILGILLILPGTRHALIYSTRAWILKKMSQGAFRVFQAGPGMRADFRTYRYEAGQGMREVREERDAQVLDVTPIEIEHSRKEDDKP